MGARREADKAKSGEPRNPAKNQGHASPCTHPASQAITAEWMSRWEPTSSSLATFPQSTGGRGGLECAIFGVAKSGVETMWDQFSNTTGKLGTKFPHCGTRDHECWLLLPMGLWLVGFSFLASGYLLLFPRLACQTARAQGEGMCRPRALKTTYRKMAFVVPNSGIPNFACSYPPPPPLSFPTPREGRPPPPPGGRSPSDGPPPPLGDRTTTVHAHLQAQKLQHKTKEFSIGCVQRAANVPTP